MSVLQHSTQPAVDVNFRVLAGGIPGHDDCLDVCAGDMTLSIALQPACGLLGSLNGLNTDGLTWDDLRALRAMFARIPYTTLAPATVIYRTLSGGTPIQDDTVDISSGEMTLSIALEPGSDLVGSITGLDVDALTISDLHNLRAILTRSEVVYLLGEAVVAQAA